MDSNKPSILFLITARGGSKGLPGKNIRTFCRKPLICWTIETALKSKFGGKVIVSTDSDEIATIALNAGAEVPFLRPAKLAKDSSSSVDVVLHAISWFEKQKQIFDLVVLLEPTSPLRDEADIDLAIEVLLRNKKAQSMVGVARAETAHPAFMATMKNKFLIPFQKNSFSSKRRQEISDVYFFEGSLYISRIDALKKKKKFYHDKTLGHVMPKWKSYEIDDLTDFILVEKLMEEKLKGSFR